MASRCCLVELPSHLRELPQAPRIGPLSRVGLGLDCAAAGHRFPLGELNVGVTRSDDYDGKSQNHGGFPIDTIIGKRRSGVCQTASLDTVASNSFACSRRATSAPPPLLTTQPAQLISMQACRPIPEVDLGLSARRQCKMRAIAPETHHKAAEGAAGVYKIEGVNSKKHFHGPLSPRHSPSPCATRAMHTIDIDERAGCGQAPANSPSDGILPVSSLCYSLTRPPNYLASPRVSPRSRSYDYFEEVLSADRYAKLIGRPHIGKGVRRMSLGLELERREMLDPGLGQERGTETHTNQPLLSASTTASECSTPLEPESQTASKKLTLNHSRSISSQLQELELPASMRAKLEKLKLSALYRRALAEGSQQDELDNVMDSEDQKEAYIQLILSKVAKKAKARKPDAMPLALRRVVASLLLSDEHVTEDMASSLRDAVRASAQAMPNAHKHGHSPRGRASCRRVTTKR